MKLVSSSFFILFLFPVCFVFADDCDPSGAVCSFTVSIACPVNSGTFKYGDRLTDKFGHHWWFWTQADYPVKLDGKWDYPDFDVSVFDHQIISIDYGCMKDRDKKGNLSEFSYVDDVKLPNNVLTFFKKHDYISVDCEFINGNPTQGAYCNAL